jgi:hypothetical protein
MGGLGERKLLKSPHSSETWFAGYSKVTERQREGMHGRKATDRRHLRRLGAGSKFGRARQTSAGTRE